MSDKEIPTARECMTSRVLSFSPDDDLFQAMDLLLKNHFAAAPVIAEDDTLLGMLTEKDCLRVLSNFTYDNNLEGGKVSDYQSVVRMVCEPELDLFGVTDRFLATNFPLLPVVDRGKLVGVISRRDTLRGVQELRRRLDLKRQKFEGQAGRQMDRPKSIEQMQKAAAGGSAKQLVQVMGRKS